MCVAQSFAATHKRVTDRCVRTNEIVMGIWATRSLPQEWQCGRAAKIRRRVPDEPVVGQAVFRHALEKAPHRHGGDEARHTAAEAEMLARPEAEMALWATIDVVDVGIGEFPPVAVAGAEGKRHLSPTCSVRPCSSVARMTVRLKRCADVLKRSDSSIAGSISAGSATMRRRALG